MDHDEEVKENNHLEEDENDAKGVQKHWKNVIGGR
jgi:hypothetical protein